MIPAGAHRGGSQPDGELFAVFNRPEPIRDPRTNLVIDALLLTPGSAIPPPARGGSRLAAHTTFEADDALAVGRGGFLQLSPTEELGPGGPVSCRRRQRVSQASYWVLPWDARPHA
jgi:hypothetical protein